MSSSIKKKKNNRKSTLSKISNHNKKKNEKTLALAPAIITEYKENKSWDDNISKVVDSKPCEKCRHYYFDPLHDEETEIAEMR
jgi:hypothetical protein